MGSMLSPAARARRTIIVLALQLLRALRRQQACSRFLFIHCRIAGRLCHGQHRATLDGRNQLLLHGCHRGEPLSPIFRETSLQHFVQLPHSLQRARNSLNFFPCFSPGFSPTTPGR